MTKIIFFTLLFGFAAALPQSLIQTPAFPEDVSNGINGRVVNGWPASETQFPHQVRMLARISIIQTSVCGGSIISSTYVLTAAHCVRGFTTFELGFGSTSFNSPSLSLTSRTKIEHANYNPSTLNNDIALLELPSALKWTKGISPIQLPSQSQASTSFLNVKGDISGFGKTKDTSAVADRLMYGHVKVISNVDCEKVYGDTVVKAFTLCTREWDVNKQSTCQGDSGGPLIWYDRSLGAEIQLGVVSFVAGRGCEAGDPAGFVRVTSYLDWIHNNTGIAIRP